MTHSPTLHGSISATPQGALARMRWLVTVGAFASVVVLAGCAVSPASDGPNATDSADDPASTSQPEEPNDEPTDEPANDVPEETCDWDSPRLSGAADVPSGQSGELAQVLIGSWQHTHTDEGAGFEEVTNDHRYVFPSTDRMLYCQHVPGATDHAQNAGDITLNDTKIELPGGKYSYTITAWDEDTIVWDNPVGGGYVYLLQRR